MSPDPLYKIATPEPAVQSDTLTEIMRIINIIYNLDEVADVLTRRRFKLGGMSVLEAIRTGDAELALSDLKNHPAYLMRNSPTSTEGDG